jgi:flavin-dependent dehydrogenase
MSSPGSSDARRAAPVAIVGAGPAGSACAAKLAALGHSVLLIEAAAFPRPHVGEALSPGVAAAAAALGIDDLLARAGAIRFARSELSWRAPGWESRPAHPDAAIVDRGRFDAVLRDAAVARGARLLQPARVRSAVRTGEGWRLSVEQDGRQRDIAARFLVDATGRSGLLGRRRGERGVPTFALAADWRGGPLDLPRVKAGRGHWLWGSPVPGRGYSLILFTDRETLRRAGRGIEDRYRAIARGEGGLGGDARCGPVAVLDATSYRNEDIAGEAHLRIGEAAFALDPLSSSGVHKAMASGITAAIAANTMIRRPGDAATARRFHADAQQLAYRRHRVWSASVHADHLAYAAEPFWRARAAAAAGEPEPARRRGGGPLALCPSARIEPVACIAGDFVERRLGVTHPALERPIVYANGRPIADLLSGTAGSLEARFHAAFPAGEAELQLSRLVESGLLVEPAPVPASHSN